MSYFPEETYVFVRKACDAVGLNEEQQSRLIDQFEKTLMSELTLAVMNKLPKQESSKLKEIFKEEAGEKEVQLKQFLKDWLADEEIKSLFVKVSNKLVGELLVDLYKEAKDDQKQKLKQLFKPEVFEGV